MTLEVKFNVEVTNQDIDDIMCTALEGGITYWCKGVKVIGGQYFGEYAHEQISRGGSLMLYDIDSSDKWELTLDKFKHGLQLYLSEHTEAIDGNEVGTYQLDTSYIDAYESDYIIQYALFNEIVFG